MPAEIEDRFLVFVPPALAGLTPHDIIQGYLSGAKGPTVRVRKVDDCHGFLTIKGKKTDDGTPEFEYPIPVEDARELLALCGDVFLTKNRYEIAGPDGKVWELDIFTGRHAGIIIAEFEKSYKGEPYVKPVWLGPEITKDKRLGNGSLARSDMKDIQGWVDSYRPRPAPKGSKPSP